MTLAGVALVLLGVLAATVRPAELQLGYPHRIKVFPESRLCAHTVAVPANTARLRVLITLADVTVNVILYAAAPGVALERSAAQRVSPLSSFRDTEVVLDRPRAGVWTIGVWASCLACLGNFDGELSAVVLSAAHQPVVAPALPDRRTAYVGVREGSLAFFEFALAETGAVHFEIRSLLSSSLDTFALYVRKDAPPSIDFPEGTRSLTLAASLVPGRAAAEAELEAGKWVAGLHAASVVAESTNGGLGEFEFAFAVGREPEWLEPDTAELCADTGDAPLEEEDGFCATLSCDRCLATDGCRTCRIDSRGFFFERCQIDDGSGRCSGKFALWDDAEVTDANECVECEGLSCEACIAAGPHCSLCAVDLGNSLVTSGCEVGASCFGIGAVGLRPQRSPDVCAKDRLFDWFSSDDDGVDSNSNGGDDGDDSAVRAGLSEFNHNAPPIGADGTFLSPDEIDALARRECAELDDTCDAHCATHGGVKSCLCWRGEPLVYCVEQAPPLAVDASAQPSASENPEADVSGSPSSPLSSEPVQDATSSASRLRPLWRMCM